MNILDPSANQVGRTRHSDVTHERQTKENLRFATWGEQNENRRNYGLPKQSKNKKEEEDKLERLAMMDERSRNYYGLPERRTQQEEKELLDIRSKYLGNKYNFMTVNEQKRVRILSNKDPPM